VEPQARPPPALVGHVEALWTATIGAAPEVRRVPPDGCLDLVAVIDATTVSAHVYGPTARYDDVTLTPGQRLVGLRFVAGVGALALAARADQLLGDGHRLDDVAPAAAATLRGAARAEDVPGRLVAAAAALVARARPTVEHRRAARAIAAFAAGADRIADVAADLGVAERTLHRDFLVGVGLAPRRYLRVARARRAAALIAAGRPLADVAATCGYADQAHLTRELVALHGVTPGALRRSRDHVRNLQAPAAPMR